MKKRGVYKMTDATKEKGSGSTPLLVSGIVVGIRFLSAFLRYDRNFQSAWRATPFVGLFVLVPILGFTLAYGTSAWLRHALDEIPLWLITIAHTLRFTGLVFVIGAMMNLLPREFGFPEGLGDIVGAAPCLPLARALRGRSHSPQLRTAFIAWNVFGLIDLVSAISLGILNSPASFGVLRMGISTKFMTAMKGDLRKG